MLLGPLCALLVGLVSGSCSVPAGTLDTTVGLKPVYSTRLMMTTLLPHVVAVVGFSLAGDRERWDPLLFKDHLEVFLYHAYCTGLPGCELSLSPVWTRPKSRQQVTAIEESLTFVYYKKKKRGDVRQHVVRPALRPIGGTGLG